VWSAVATAASGSYSAAGVVGAALGNGGSSNVNVVGSSVDVGDDAVWSAVATASGDCSAAGVVGAALGDGSGSTVNVVELS
jgi:hypothetical protein